MKKMLLLIASIAFTGLVHAQSSFSDDFEGYSSGDMIAATSSTWRTWNNASGIDAVVSDEQASSGTNSLLIQSATPTANGPTDLILPFGGKHAFGNFSFEMMMYVEGGAYFNFQGEVAEGQEWTFQPEFNAATGTVSINNSENAAVETVDFPVKEWFKFSVVVDLTLNNWEVSINDNLAARFANPTNTIASLNIYPLAGHKFYVDDLSYDYKPFSPQGLDLGIAGLGVPPRALKGKSYPIKATVINVGTTPITSFDINWTDGTNNGSTSANGLSLGLLQTNEIEFPEAYTADPDNSELTFTISNINGMDDDSDLNNSKSTTVGVITPAPDKAVFVEEGTGTWCGFCPRGAVGMEYMKHEYPEYFVGVAVHNSASTWPDPMYLADHDDGVTDFPGFTGFPGGVFERSEVVNPAGASLESTFFNYITKAPVATLHNEVHYDGDTRTIDIEVQTTAKENAAGAYKLVVIVREDNVSGSGFAWRQANYYSGGGRGEMGGYEMLPDPVPGDDMVYNEVSRALLTPFSGEAGGLPSTDLVMGETYTWTGSYTVPADQNVKELAIASVLLAPDGTSSNAKLTYHDDWATPSVDVDNVANHEGFKGIFPNPASDITFINLDLKNAEEINVQISNSVGKILSVKDYGQLSGAQKLPFNTSELANGIYFAKIVIGDQFITRAISVNR